jgi:hypothetical protein
MSYEKALIDAARDAHDALAVITRTSHIATQQPISRPKAFTQAKEAYDALEEIFPAALDGSTAEEVEAHDALLESERIKAEAEMHEDNE